MDSDVMWLFSTLLRRMGSSHSAAWQWEDGSRGGGKWVDYTPELDSLLQAAHSAGHQTVTLTIGGKPYVVDFLRKTQKKTDTGYVRRVRQTPQPVDQWEWEDGNYGSGNWKPYDAASGLALGRARAGGQQTLTLKLGGNDYDIELSALTQTKQSTGFVRQIRIRAERPTRPSPSPSPAAQPPSPTPRPATPAPAPTPTPAPKPPPADQWEWEDGDSGSGNWKPYDSASAAALTAALANGDDKVTLNVGPRQYVVVFNAMKQAHRDSKYERRVRRGGAQASQSSTSTTMLGGFPGTLGHTPVYWSQLGRKSDGSVRVQWLTVPPDRPLYKEVVGMMQETQGGSYDILELCLNLDKGRFLKYCASREAFLAQPNERWLWHGTAAEKLPAIQANGFSRDYNSRGAYGKGVYFAKNCSYSLNHTYAKPDGQGVQHLLLTRVLLGESCVGAGSMDKPAFKKGSSFELCDSMVDNLATPSIFVLSTGSDAHAFPEFLLKVKKK